MALRYLILFTLFALNSATPFCCDLSFNCLNNQRSSTGGYKIGSSLKTAERDLCTKQGRANWCVAKYTDDMWWCTSPGNFIRFLDGYKTRCKGKVFPTKGTKAPCCRSEGGIEAQCNFALRDLKKMKC